MVKYQIVNVVTTASLDQPMDFVELKKHGEIFNNSDVYGGRVAYFKTKQMEGKVEIFLSGKIISVGAKSEAQATKELLIAEQFLVEKGLIKNIELHPKIQNMVISADFEQLINLKEFSEKTNAIYQPEQFPGAILKLQQPIKASILMFASGKTIIAGLINLKQVEAVIQQIKKFLALKKLN